MRLTWQEVLGLIPRIGLLAEGLAAAEPACQKKRWSEEPRQKNRAPCARAKSPSNCRRGSTPPSTISGASVRHGSGVRTVRRIRARAMPVCTVVLDPRWVARPDRSRKRHPRGRALLDGPGAPRPRAAGAASLPERRGTFALRSPVRPNPIAVSVARIVRIEGNEVTVIGLDCLDDTPLLDLKPYFASTNSVPDASVGWHAGIRR